MINNLENASLARPKDDVGVIALLNSVLRRRGLVILTVLAVELIVLAMALTRPLRYTTVVAFMPEGQRPNSGVSSLAAQFGVNVASSDGLNSPQFYPELIRSPQFLASVLDGQFPDSGSANARPLSDVLEIPPGDPRFRRQVGIEKLGKAIVPGVAPRTGIVSVSVTASSPELARTLAARVLNEITRFNQHTRQGRAAAERQFIEGRIADVKDSLRMAEDRLQRFLQSNRDFTRSPTLSFEHTRIERDVNAQQMVLATLGPSYEQARIEEVRDTPVLTVLRRPEAPVRPDPRGRVRLMALGLIGGLALGIVLAVGVELWRSLRRSENAEVQELSSIVSEITSEARRGRFAAALFGANGGMPGTRRGPATKVDSLPNS